MQHLAHHNFDVLVVDFDALGLVDFLDFFDEIAVGLFEAADAQNVVWVFCAVGEVIAGMDEIAGMDC